MPVIETIPDAFVFMKVGDHAGESFEKILSRKNREFQETGMTFWGYGGTSCHPLTQVQPFAKGIVEKHGSIYLLMEPVKSNADPDLLPATEYSEDGVTWKKIPDKIVVTGSRYALVLGEIVPGDLDIAANSFVVGVGPSRGKTAADYLQGRVDKACLLRDEATLVSPDANSDEKQALRKVKLMAKMIEPYAVMLRNS